MLKMSQAAALQLQAVMVVTALVAVLGITGTAYGAKLITGLDIKDGSITTVDLSKETQTLPPGRQG